MGYGPLINGKQTAISKWKAPGLRSCLESPTDPRRQSLLRRHTTHPTWKGIYMLYLSNLCLEVTRKCNLRCAHCLRGNPQRVTMTPINL
jgi:hypothetical protein